MRTTIDIPEREHRIFKSLAHARNTSLSKIVVELARRGLETTGKVSEPEPKYEISPVTGFPTFRSERPVTAEDVRSLEDEE